MAAIDHRKFRDIIDQTMMEEWYRDSKKAFSQSSPDPYGNLKQLCSRITNLENDAKRLVGDRTKAYEEVQKVRRLCNVLLRSIREDLVVARKRCNVCTSESEVPCVGCPQNAMRKTMAAVLDMTTAALEE